MGSVQITTERFIASPADVVYHCSADYNQHHRPEGFCRLCSQISGSSAAGWARRESRFARATATTVDAPAGQCPPAAGVR